MTSYLRFDSQSREQFSQYGLSFEWLASLFLGDKNSEFVPSFLKGIASSQKQFADRQTLASGTAYVNVRQRRFDCADPWEAGARCSAMICLTGDRQDSLPFDMLPLYYGCRSATGEEFWVCIYGTYGQVTQIFFPARQLVIFDIAQENAAAVVGSLQSLLSRHAENVVALKSATDRGPTRCVGLLDMVTNFGHQAINHLSGVQRLVDLELLSNLDEVWVSGVLFFGKIESLFPELDGRVRYFSDRWHIASELLREPLQVIRIGSTYLSSALRRRILKNVREVYAPKRPNMLVVTVRAAGRLCVNLPEVVGELHRSLRSRYDLKIALDGWVLPESALVAASSVGAAVSNQYLSVIREEMALAREIEKRLPSDSIVLNTIGRSMLESLSELATATAYFSHVGTLQHKLGLLLGLPGVVHGPKLQIANPEGGPYLAEEGLAPVFMPEDAIADIPALSARGPSFADYRIVDLTFPTNALASFLGLH